MLGLSSLRKAYPPEQNRCILQIEPTVAAKLPFSELDVAPAREERLVLCEGVQTGRQGGRQAGANDNTYEVIYTQIR